MKLSLIAFLLLTIFASALCRLETMNKNIPVSPARAECNVLPNPNTRPACVNTYGFSKLDIEWIPSDWQCPCKVNAGDGGHIAGATGSPSASNPDASYFQDYQLASGFINPVAISFADDGKTLFVGTRDGIIWHVDLDTGLKTMFYDISLEVGFSGDRGLMDVRAHPNYANVKQMLILFTVDDTPGDGQEPHSESSMQQRIIRVSDQDLNGVRDEGFRLDILGASNTKPYDGVPICFNTHAVGSIQFGWDASFFVTTGEGAHWNFDMGDWGQDATVPGVLDADCRLAFGAEQDIGAFRSQYLNSLGGKLLRITPDGGDGICGGSQTGAGYPVKNPFCSGPTDPGTSATSKVWALGLRNPFRMTVRPPLPGEANGSPGVPYFGDVGQGGYEEINAVIQPGLNFGWPCWEGPMPNPMYRDSYYNFDVNHDYQIGCKGGAGADGPCNPIQTIAYDTDGTRLTCPHIYYNKTTTLPFFYYSRFLNFDNAGYFGEIGYTGQGFIGASIGGLTFYKGTKYPTRFHNQLFILDFSEKWIRVIHKDPTSDEYVSIEDFAELIYTPPLDGAKVTLETHPNGDVCYVTMNGGEVRCFAFVVSNIAPTPVCGAVETTFQNVPFTVQFTSDGTYDRENDQMVIEWDFGGGAKSNQGNPTFQFNTAGPHTVYMTATDSFGNRANCSIVVSGGNKRPSVRITSPVPNLASPQKVVEILSNGTIFNFQASVIDDDTVFSYSWDFTLVHNNHVHPKAAEFTTPTFNLAATQIPNEGNVERNNLMVILTVTDPDGAKGTDFIRFNPLGWTTLFGNVAPVPDFSFSGGFSPLQVGQPVRFDATATRDNNGDRIDYFWTWGDGFNGTGSANSHFYDTAGTYDVTLMVVDNWGASNTLTKQVTIGPATAVQPSISPEGGKKFAFQTVTLATITNGATIYYTIDGSDPTVVGGSRVAYTVPFIVTFVPYTNVTVRAVATRSGLAPSAVSQVTFQFFPPPCNTLAINPSCSLSCVNTENSQPLATEELLPISRLGAGVLPTDDKIKRYLIANVTGTYDPSKQATRLKILVDADAAGQIVQAKVSYDFTNDGTWDRTEMFNIFAPNDVAGWEMYQSANDWTNARYHPTGVSGTYQNLTKGTIMLQIWQANQQNNGRVKILTGDFQGADKSLIEIPYIQDSTSQTGGEPCISCTGNILPDICGTCGGPGLVGCDLQCFSTKVNDTCGTCGGPGVTGCDRICFSTKVVDSCGVCGGTGGCGIPAGNLLPANDLALRGVPCSDMIPEIGNTLPFQNVTIPDPFPNVFSVPNGIPNDAQYYTALAITNVTGFYNIDREFTYLELYVDALGVGQQQLGIAVQYDFTGDGSWDRTEIYQAFPPNDIPNWERVVRYGRMNVPNAQGLQMEATGAFANLVRGNVRVVVWIAGQGTNHGPVWVRTNGETSYLEPGSQISHIRIPYITAYWPNFEAQGECGAVGTRNDPITTAQQTTDIFTTALFTTQQQTTALRTTGEQTTFEQTTVAAQTTEEQLFSTQQQFSTEQQTTAVEQLTTAGNTGDGSNTLSAAVHISSSSFSLLFVVTFLLFSLLF